MTEVDMLLRDTLTDRAEAAPDGHGLLTRVRTRSRLIRRRRRVGVAGAGVTAVLLGVAGVPVVTGLLPDDSGGGGENVGGPSASKTVTPSGSKTYGTDRAPSPPDGTTSAPPPFTAPLGAPTFTVPKVPFTPPTGVIEGLAPGVPMYDGKPMIMHSPEGDATGKPMLSLYIDATSGNADGVPGDKTPVQVRGVAGTVFKPTDRAHPGLELSWTERDGTPMHISAANIPDEQVIAYANGLTKTDLPVAAPFSFTLLPQGVELDNVGPSNMVFKVPGQQSSADFSYKLGFFLNAYEGDGTASWPLTVGPNKARFAPQDDHSRILNVLMVSQPTSFVMQIQIPENIKMTDDDVIRMAGGITVNGSAKAGRG